jgi:adenylylsulfate kinase
LPPRDVLARFHRVSREDRERLLGQKGVVAWLTGLSGSGKTSVAHGTEWILHDRRRLVRSLDGDEFRAGLSLGLGFSMEDRRENIRRIAETARILVDSGMVVLVSAVSPTIAIRELARSIIGAEAFLEVFVNCPLAVCEERDPKGLYRRARAGEIPGFTGIDSPYEAPIAPDLEIRTDVVGLAEATHLLAASLEERAVLPECRS